MKMCREPLLQVLGVPDVEFFVGMTEEHINAIFQLFGHDWIIFMNSEKNQPLTGTVKQSLRHASRQPCSVFALRTLLLMLIWKVCISGRNSMQDAG